VAGPTVELDPGLRRSRTLHHLDDVISAMFEPTLRAMLPAARQELGVPWFRLGTIERQLHVHGPGDFFGVHVDNGTGATAGRLVSAVYYFHETPRRFTGGSLWLYDQFDVGGRLYTAPRRTVIEPSDNSLVIFPSSVPHTRFAPPAARTGQPLSITFWFRVTEDGADLGAVDGQTEPVSRSVRILAASCLGQAGGHGRADPSRGDPASLAAVK
jgi:Rps23 Pro-64 3,4-dihydroxylase Tpa1-like proline 4-hydroxylase